VVPRPVPNLQPVPKVYWEGMNVIESRTAEEAIALIADRAAGRGVELLVIPSAAQARLPRSEDRQ